jgi:zinc transporter ZupT
MMLTASGTLAFEGFHAENDQDRLYWGLSCAQRMSGGFLLGIAFIILIKWLLDADDIGVGELQGADAKRALLVMAVMTLHSFAEGVGIGVAFSGEEEGHELGTFIALSLAIHNVPEGLAVAVVLIPRGVSLISTAGWSIFSSLPQPLVAIPVFLFVSAAIPWLPVGLGFASGAMLYVALFELLPEASHLINAPTTVTLTVVSSAVMVVLQNAARVPVA